MRETEKKCISVTLYIRDITKLEHAINEVSRISRKHPYVSVNIEVGKPQRLVWGNKTINI